MVKALCDIARHFQMLDLVTANRHAVGVEHQNIGGHQYGIRKQPHIHPVIGLNATGHILIHRCLVSMGAIHQALGCNAREDPA